MDDINYINKNSWTDDINQSYYSLQFTITHYNLPDKLISRAFPGHQAKLVVTQLFDKMPNKDLVTVMISG